MTITKVTDKEARTGRQAIWEVSGRFARRMVAGVFIVLAACTGLGAREANNPQVWLSGVDPFVRKAMKGGPSDYMDLFRDDAPWAKAASNVRVFKTSTQWIMNGSSDELTRMFAALEKRGIALGMEALILTRDDQACGQSIEGYSAAQTMRRAAERIRDLGGKLGYIAFDEPLWFGHVYGGANACHASLEEIARNAAVNIRQVKEIFPDVRIGDIEPLAQNRPADWVDTILRWTDIFQTTLNLPLDFFHVDVEWLANYDLELTRLAAEFGKRGIRLGIIYNGDPDDPDDVTWTKKAETRFDFVETRLNIVPNDAVLQTWMLHPAQMLPESQPGTMTNLVNRYARKRTTLSLQSEQTQIVGVLTDSDGNPIPNAEVSIVSIEDGRTGALVSRLVTGRVPEKAVNAVLGLRMNSECGCSGTGDVGVGVVKYRDIGGDTSISLPQNGRLSSKMSVTPPQFTTTPEAPIRVTSSQFPVNAGKIYRMKVPMRATSDAGKAGYLALIFLGADNREIKRNRIIILPGERPLAILTTDKDGKFELQSKAEQDRKLRRATFAGNDGFRSATQPTQ